LTDGLFGNMMGHKALQPPISVKNAVDRESVMMLTAG